MKKKILLFVLAFAMMFTSLVNVAFADDAGAGDGTGDDTGTTVICQCPAHNPDAQKPSMDITQDYEGCQGAQYVNIASTAELSTPLDGNNWMVTYHLDKLVDGNWHQGTLSGSRTYVNTAHFTFNKPNNVKKIVTVVNSWGQGSGSGGATCGSEGVLTENAYGLSVTIYHIVDGQEVQYLKQDPTDTGDGQTRVLEIPDGVNASKITVEWVYDYNIWGTLWEVEVWSDDTVHDWEVSNVDTAPTCTEKGVGDYICSCGATLADSVIMPTGHTPSGEWVVVPAVPEVPAVEDDPDTPDVDETAAAIPAVPEQCYQKCANEGCEEKLDLGAHSYSSDCDLACNKCSTARPSSTAHFYAADCQELCSNCGEARETTVEHTYDHACDELCDLCLETRETAGHKYTDCADTECDNANENDPTKKCGFIRTDAPGHTWDSTCDNECNVCGAPNPEYAPGHSWTDACDTACDIEGCDYTREVAPHAGATCDATTCKECGAAVTPTAHTYPTCDATACSVCGGGAREALAHTYDNDCDTTCNACSSTREVPAHVYDNNCDNECNACGVANPNYADHVYGEDFEKNEDNFKVFTCTVCGYKNVTDEKAGLSGGAIAGIVIGAVAVVAIGAYAAYYFLVVKKKQG